MPVVISRCPPGTLWRIALSIRLAISRSSSRGSPAVGRGVQRCANVEIEAGELRLVGEHGLGGEGREVDALAALEPGLAAGQREQRVDQLLEVLLGCEHALVGCAQ